MRCPKSLLVSGIVTFILQGGKLQALIAGSVGPYGACQHDGSEYTGSYVEHMTKQVVHVIIT